jgi:type I restriction enzyme S subunit
LFQSLDISKLISGSAQPQVTVQAFNDFYVPLPPLAEQQRIVERIESLFDKLYQAKVLIQDSLNSFENRKAAILQKAFTGELTKKWREENKINENYLLSDILKYYSESKVKKDIENILECQNSVQRIINIENSIWYQCSVGAVGVVSNGSTPSRQNLDYWDGGIPWISSGEVRNNIIEISKETISQIGYENSSVKMLPAGTVLIAMIGEGKTRGQSAILNINSTINQNIAAIDVSHKKVESKFMWYWLQKQYQNNREKGSGTGPQALNCQRVRELDFVLPPISEQKEIVRILDDIFEKEQNANELYDQIENIELVKKAILARAFRGELGTNDPVEENAIQLLKEVLAL